MTLQGFVCTCTALSLEEKCKDGSTGVDPKQRPCKGLLGLVLNNAYIWETLSFSRTYTSVETIEGLEPVIVTLLSLHFSV